MGIMNKNKNYLSAVSVACMHIVHSPASFKKVKKYNMTDKINKE